MADAGASVYEASDISNVTPAQMQFASEFNNDFESDPVSAMSSYAKIMHEHTRRQMAAATQSSRRRSITDGAVQAQANLSKENSISSTDSRGSE